MPCNPGPWVRESITEEGVLKKPVSGSGTYFFVVNHDVSVNTVDEFFFKFPEPLQHIYLLFLGEIVHDRQEEMPVLLLDMDRIESRKYPEDFLNLLGGAIFSFKEALTGIYQPADICTGDRMFLFEFVNDLLMFRSERFRFQFHEEDILLLAMVAAVRMGPEKINGRKKKVRVRHVMFADPLFFSDKQVNLCDGNVMFLRRQCNQLISSWHLILETWNMSKASESDLPETNIQDQRVIAGHAAVLLNGKLKRLLT